MIKYILDVFIKICLFVWTLCEVDMARRYTASGEETKFQRLFEELFILFILCSEAIAIGRYFDEPEWRNCKIYGMLFGYLIRFTRHVLYRVLSGSGCPTRFMERFRGWLYGKRK